MSSFPRGVFFSVESDVECGGEKRRGSEQIFCSKGQEQNLNQKAGRVALTRTQFHPSLCLKLLNELLRETSFGYLTPSKHYL